MIKKIHYCWFGGKELPKDVKKCIETWKKILPDYEIKEWNEKNFDINTSNFVKEAYENKKWAFVSDYVRIYALYNEGGIYFDTDMKLLKDVSKIVDKKMFLGYEDSGYVGTAVIGINEKHSKYMKEILDYYDNIEHFNVEFIYNYANPVIITKVINQYKKYENEDGITIFDDNIYVYPREYFYPLSYNYAEKKFTDNTCMVHLFNATWADKGEKRVIGIYRKFGPKLGKFINKVIDSIFNFKNYVIHKIKSLYNWARMKYSIHINRNKRVNNIKSVLENKKENYIVIAHPENTEEKNSIEGLFKDNIIEIREQYTKKEATKIAKVITESNKDTVIFDSYVEGWDMLMSAIKDINKKIKIKIIIHGGIGLLSDEIKWNLFNKVIDLYYKRDINEIGFFNKSLYEFHKQKGYDVQYLMKNIDIKDKEKYRKEKQNSKLIQVGLYKAYDNYMKNIFSQIEAVSLIENAKLECIPTNYKIAMLGRKYNINLTGEARNLSKEELYEKMAGNDVNLCLTTLDDDDNLPIESLELGTVCVTGKSYSYFKGTELEKYITVDTNDDIIEIKNKIEYVLENKEKILSLYKEWKENYLKEAEKRKIEFLK